MQGSHATWKTNEFWEMLFQVWKNLEKQQFRPESWKNLENRKWCMSNFIKWYFQKHASFSKACFIYFLQPVVSVFISLLMGIPNFSLSGSVKWNWLTGCGSAHVIFLRSSLAVVVAIDLLLSHWCAKIGDFQFLTAAWSEKETSWYYRLRNEYAYFIQIPLLAHGVRVYRNIICDFTCDFRDFWQDAVIISRCLAFKYWIFKMANQIRGS